MNFTRKEVDITFDESAITLRQVVELLSSIHYIPDLSVSLSDKKEDSPPTRSCSYKIGVAGFAFINMMTYSLPAYLTAEPLEDNLHHFSVFSAISW